MQRINGLVGVFFILLSTAIVLPGEKKSPQIVIDRWLLLGPVEQPLPAFHDEGKTPFVLADLLKFDEGLVAAVWPEKFQEVRWPMGDVSRWREVQSEEGRISIAPLPVPAVPQVAFLATYVRATRWVKARLEVSSPQLFRVFVDGKSVAVREKVDAEASGAPVKATVKLETGKHLIVIKTVRKPGEDLPWDIEARFKIDTTFGRNALQMGTDPTHWMNIRHLLEGPKVTGVSISPDGELATVTLRRVIPPEGKAENWIELRRVADGALVETYRGGKSIRSVKWAPDGKQFSYTTREKEKNNLWIVDVRTGDTRLLLEGIPNLTAHLWSPDGRFIVYEVEEKAPENKTGVKRVLNLRDRWPWSRNRTYLYRVDVLSGIRQQLTAGALSTDLDAISPDGQWLIFERERDDYEARPYVQSEVFRLHLRTLQVDTLFVGRWFDKVKWSPDGKKLLFLGGPSMFGKLGHAVPEGVIPNEFDTQAYLMDLDTREVECLTNDFLPDIVDAYWAGEGKTIYFLTIDREYRNLYRCDWRRKRFRKLDTGIEVINSFRLARERPVGVYYGSSATRPHVAMIMDLGRNRYRVLADPSAEDFRHVQFGKVEKWNFLNRNGVEIEGRIYYPPDFDPRKTYPCIVYYYGGVNPTNRAFGGRYPKNLFAAQGYVVYVLQPSGATGYGQAFSALHVNDWGKRVADEIIDGVTQFLEAHPFVDRSRVGAIGASYGGFMTMLLMTQTDIFATGIAHAGISSISSYWGEGYWGYIYNAMSAAYSFPWNRKDIYVDQSPLFRADKVKNPLLLLHGTVDTNVPPGESTQFFAALKILGKKVEYVQILDQNHHILDYKKRRMWQRTILAWFDRWLKDQPEWWYDLYPPVE